MTKEQYLKTIETVIKSHRNDIQKITILKYSFEAYVEDEVKEEVKESDKKDEIIEFLFDVLEQEHLGLRALIALEVKNKFGIEY